MARDVLTERYVAQAGTRQARSTAVDTEAWNVRTCIRFWFGGKKSKMAVRRIINNARPAASS